ncbi:MAG: sialate O-acetylesterase [Oceanipulchritudo sp.]
MLKSNRFPGASRKALPLFLVLQFLTSILFGDVSVTNLFGDHMVLQRDKPVVVWGKADPGEAVSVQLDGASAATVADATGAWKVALPAMPAGGPYTLRVNGENELVFSDVLVGEVWVASGQSNMQWTVGRSLNADLVELTVRRNNEIRSIPVRNMGSQEPQGEIPGKWAVATSQTVPAFSAVAYAFAETVHAALGVPVGIIDNAWGGSAAEAWVPREVIAADPVLQSIHERWLEIEENYDHASELAEWEAAMAKWETDAAAARAAGLEKPNRPRRPQDRMYAQHRPGNLWNGRVLPIVPFTIRGTIWYQGENNANTARGGEYKTLFPTLIRAWRKAWNEEFPFYWVQLADFKEESSFSPDDNWPLLREAQTHTLNTVPATGQAVIIDLGEGRDIHPRQKEEVGRRLARWALNRDYGFTQLACRSPEFDSFSQEGDRLVVKFNYTGSGLRAFDTKAVKGFAVQTGDGEWISPEGRVVAEDTVELVLPEEVSATALRYAWADNPVCNLFSYEGLPATPFRTDQP